MHGVPAPMVASQKVLWSVGIFQLIKTTEIVSGLMLLTGFLPALASIFLAPICIGVIVYNLSIAPIYVISGLVVSILNGYLGFVYWDKYKTLFVR